MAPLDLTRPRDLGDLLRTAFDLWSRHLGVLAALTAVLVVPVVLLGRLLSGALGEDDGPGTAFGALLVLLVLFVGLQAVVTVVGLLVVQAAGRGETPALGATARASLAALPAALAVVAVYAVGVAFASVLLVVPGIWLAVRWYVAPQQAVAEGAGASAALSESAALVRGRWWRTAGLLVVLVGLPSLLSSIAQEVLRGVSDAGVAVVLTAAVTETLALSFGAVASALVFYDLRSRTRVPAGPAPLVHPERPGAQPG
jgi:hypothetical protein